MKKPFVSLIVISFATIAVFGFLAIDHNNMANNGCFVSTLAITILKVVS